MASSAVTVIGAGVIGLSVAHELALAGYHVSVVADVDTLDTVSAVAAALWFPHETERSASATALLQRSRDRFDRLALDPATGVILRSGLVIERHEGADRTWLGMTPGTTAATSDELPPGALAGIRASLPMIVTPTYLGWLRMSLAGLGVTFAQRRISRLAELRDSTDVIVVAAGIRGGELLGDDASVYPIRGQVVRLSNPGLTEWLLDDENPEGITYVVPRVDDVIVGGTGNVGSWDLEADLETEESILRRAIALVPALAGLPVLSRSVGLRPARPTIRLERLSVDGIPVVTAYGHGGAGVTLSWGTAERVVELVREVSAS